MSSALTSVCAPARGTYQRGAHEGRLPQETYQGEENQGHEEHRRRFRHQDAAGDPEIGCQGRQCRRDQSNARAGDGLPEETNAEDHPSSQDGHGEELSGTRFMGDDEADRSEEERRQGWMRCRGCGVERDPEELVRRQFARGDAVPKGVVELAGLVARHEEYVPDAEGQTEEHHAGERPGKPSWRHGPSDRGVRRNDVRISLGGDGRSRLRGDCTHRHVPTRDEQLTVRVRHSLIAPLEIVLYRDPSHVRGMGSGIAEPVTLTLLPPARVNADACDPGHA